MADRSAEDRDGQFREFFRTHIIGVLADADPTLAGVRDGTDEERLLSQGTEQALLQRCAASLESATKLDLKKQQLGPVGITGLAVVLSRMAGMTSLDLGENDLGAEGAVALAGALGSMHGMTSLRLDYNYLGAEGAVALAGALGSRGGLTSLGLD